jgi:virginiamycin B lyase
MGLIGMIGRINLAGTIDVIMDLPDNNQAFDITAGADGAIWFTEPNVNKIGRLPSLAFEFPLLMNSAILGMRRGPDDSIWYADAGGNRVGRLDPSGSLVQFELGVDTRHRAAGGADGGGWFTGQRATPSFASPRRET